ncbi:hypothetical protein LNQ82_03450 [Conchiformibius steedae DSM 2580]|uniref:Periplasmic protein n=1 Tax=Conchiformibius steedae DSM 2580 TaxID=1121352 RepID=A0AAE9L0M4_9NEIS|nr:hypothetical protein [Conchiformibius steedae]QMT33570.1 hypothetical protein H3L98_00520 [Conchiformibius steedae]URD68229.1 hypothetical protein LNQ82_03450 [Conchiformibius steedae DSM 2580]
MKKTASLIALAGALALLGSQTAVADHHQAATAKTQKAKKLKKAKRGSLTKKHRHSKTTAGACGAAHGVKAGEGACGAGKSKAREGACGGHSSKTGEGNCGGAHQSTGAKAAEGKCGH